MQLIHVHLIWVGGQKNCSQFMWNIQKYADYIWKVMGCADFCLKILTAGLLGFCLCSGSVGGCKKKN